MNETEIEEMVGENCLNGISTKPMSKDQLGRILSKHGLITGINQKDGQPQ
jgi:hypothetical protein